MIKYCYYLRNSIKYFCFCENHKKLDINVFKIFFRILISYSFDNGLKRGHFFKWFEMTDLR